MVFTIWVAGRKKARKLEWLLEWKREYFELRKIGIAWWVRWDERLRRPATEIAQRQWGDYLAAVLLNL